MTEVLWETPPSPGRAKKADAEVFADVLRNNPRRWAHLTSTNARPAALSLARSIREGNKGFSPAGAFETATRRDAQMTGARVVHAWFVYVRFVGEVAT